MHSRCQIQQRIGSPLGILQQQVGRIDAQFFFQPVDQPLQIPRHLRHLLAERFGLGCGDIVEVTHARGVTGEWPKTQGGREPPTKFSMLPRGGPRQSSQLARTRTK